jgi:hypothetical protein
VSGDTGTPELLSGTVRSVSPTRAFTEGPSLSIAIGLLLALAAGLHFWIFGFDSESVRSLARATARSSLLLFSAASAASSLRRLWPSQVSAWLLRNRRYLGLGFAASHALHLACVIAVIRFFPEDYQTDLVALIFGGAAYGFLAAMAATSTDAAVAKLGRARWQRLHTIGIWYIHFIFAFTLVPETFASPLHFAQGLLAIAVPVLRVAGRPRRGHR